MYAAVEVTVGDNVANAAQFNVSGRAEEAGGGQVCIRAAGGHCGHVVNTTTVTTVTNSQNSENTQNSENSEMQCELSPPPRV